MSEIIKSREHVRNSVGTYDTVYKETLAELVKGSDGKTVQEHLEDITKHITQEERVIWNSKQAALTFDSTPTEGSDNPVTSGGINAALRNKANVYPYLGNVSINASPGQYPQGITFAELEGEGATPGLAVTFQGVNEWRTFQIIGMQGGTPHFRVNTATTPATWTDLASLATATPPQEYDLPLAAGVTGTVRYSKDQFGTVRLSGLISFPSDTTEISIFGTLPNGFRPQNGQYISSCGWLEGGANVVPLMLAVNADGTVAANMFAASTKYVVVQAVFLAA